MFTWHIARRLFRHSGDASRFSRPAIVVATLGVAVGVCVMILSVCITLGFQSEIQQKVIGFGAHIQVSNAEGRHAGTEGTHVCIDSATMLRLSQISGVRHVQRFCQKTGMLKTDDAFRGVAFRGVGEEYDTLFLASHLVEGRLPQRADSLRAEEVLLSSRVASQLNLSVGDRVYAYFFDQKIKARRLSVVGIYNTHLTDFDNNLVFAPLASVRRLWGWEYNQCSGAELLIHDFAQLPTVAARVAEQVHQQMDAQGNIYFVDTILDLYPQIFSWLSLLDMNVWVILALMVCVAGFTMVSGLLIVILERANFIGVMKALGADNRSIRHIFLFFSLMVIGGGLLIGNALALGMMGLQEAFHLVSLDPQDYYVDTVPLSLHWGHILLIDGCTTAACMLALLAPSYLISRIHPARSIRFE